MPDLVEIVEGFRQYDKVVVTGPQRSGTQIAARMIADILNWSFYTEAELDTRSTVYDDQYFHWLENSETRFVTLQCPRISHVCHLTPKPTLVVFMIRDVQEILDSDRHRIKKYTRLQKTTGHVLPVTSVFDDKRKQYSKLFYDSKPLQPEETPQAVYDVWNNIQKKEDFNFYELEYNLLEQHRFWIQLATRRAQFTYGTQTVILPGSNREDHN